MGKGSWTERAKCVGKSELFEVRDHAGASTPLSTRRWKGYENKKFQEAISICRTCPVQQECGETAEPEDWQWTVRAARMPTAFNTRPRGRPSTSPPPKGVNVCGNGHVGRMAKGKRGYRCYACEAEAKQAKRTPKVRELKNTCINGHTGMYERDNRGVRFCRACRRMESLKYDQKNRRAGTIKA